MEGSILRDLLKSVTIHQTSEAAMNSPSATIRSIGEAPPAIFRAAPCASGLRVSVITVGRGTEITGHDRDLGCRRGRSIDPPTLIVRIKTGNRRPGRCSKEEAAAFFGVI